MSSDLKAIAADFTSAIVRGDLDAVRHIYSPDVAVWNNVTNSSQSYNENLSLLTYYFQQLEERDYEVHAREFFPGGFVQRHTIHGRLRAGDSITAHVCLVVHVDNGKIIRLYEYLDSNAINGLF